MAPSRLTLLLLLPPLEVDEVDEAGEGVASFIDGDAAGGTLADVVTVTGDVTLDDGAPDGFVVDLADDELRS